MITMMDTVWSNLQYGLATNIAESTAMYATILIVQGLTGGINIPFAMGTGVVNTTVNKLGLVGISSLGMII